MCVKSKQTHLYNVTAVHTSNTMTGLSVVLCILCAIEAQGLVLNLLVGRFSHPIPHAVPRPAD